ncbi:MAG: hypothetical protein ACH350_03285 [Parachlamydiaceae bacterium]
MALCATQAQAQDCYQAAPCETVCYDECPAYCDSGKASYWSAAIPVGAIVVAAIIIASTHNHHHHSSSSNGGGGGGGRHSRSLSSRSSSSSFSHN